MTEPINFSAQKCFAYK